MRTPLHLTWILCIFELTVRKTQPPQNEATPLVWILFVPRCPGSTHRSVRTWHVSLHIVTAKDVIMVIQTASYLSVWYRCIGSTGNQVIAVRTGASALCLGYCVPALCLSTVSQHCVSALCLCVSGTVSQYCVSALCLSHHCVPALCLSTVSQHCVSALCLCVSALCLSHHCVPALCPSTVSQHYVSPTTVSHHLCLGHCVPSQCVSEIKNELNYNHTSDMGSIYLAQSCSRVN